MLGCLKSLVDTGWAISPLVCMSGFRKHTPHLVKALFLALKAILGLDGGSLVGSYD